MLVTNAGDVDAPACPRRGAGVAVQEVRCVPVDGDTKPSVHACPVPEGDAGSGGGAAVRCLAFAVARQPSEGADSSFYPVARVKTSVQYFMVLLVVRCC